MGRGINEESYFAMRLVWPPSNGLVLTWVSKCEQALLRGLCREYKDGEEGPSPSC